MSSQKDQLCHDIGRQNFPIEKKNSERMNLVSRMTKVKIILVQIYVLTFLENNLYKDESSIRCKPSSYCLYILMLYSFSSTGTTGIIKTVSN